MNLQRPTMRDVAAAAGVSLKTVSRVVNGEDGVSPALVARVTAAVSSLDYRPDTGARRLRQSQSRSGMIGFVLVDVSNPFFSALLRGIEEVARARDCLVLAASTDRSAERERQLVEALVERRVDGLIVVPTDSTAGPLRSEIERGTPVVFLDLDYPGQTAVDVVRSDHRGGARLATSHLLAGGHRDIAYLGDDPQIFSAELRLAGFREAMVEAGLPVPSNRIITASNTPEQWRRLATSILTTSPTPTALFTAQNFATMGAVGALHDLRLQHRVALVGFDDIEMGEAIDPGITVVPQYPLDLGRRAAERLFARLDSNDQHVYSQVIARDLIQRGSGEIPAPA